MKEANESLSHTKWNCSTILFSHSSIIVKSFMADTKPVSEELSGTYVNAKA